MLEARANTLYTRLEDSCSSSAHRLLLRNVSNGYVNILYPIRLIHWYEWKFAKFCLPHTPCLVLPASLPSLPSTLFLANRPARVQELTSPKYVIPSDSRLPSLKSCCCFLAHSDPGLDQSHAACVLSFHLSRNLSPHRTQALLLICSDKGLLLVPRTLYERCTRKTETEWSHPNKSSWTAWGLQMGDGGCGLQTCTVETKVYQALPCNL